MTLRKELKNRLSKLVAYKKNELPRLMDASFVYGDNIYNSNYLEAINKTIQEIEAAIKGIDNEKRK